MLFTSTREAGEARVYATRFASVVTYFTEDESTGGMKLCQEPGFAAAPGQYEQARDDVRTVVLNEAASRLGVAAGEVLSCPLKRLRQVADPDLPEGYRYARRARSRSPNPRPF